MSNLAILIFLTAGAVGIFLGAFFIYSVVMQKKWIEKKFFQFPLTIGSPFLNRLNFIWFGIALIIFFGGLIFAVVKGYLLK